MSLIQALADSPPFFVGSCVLLGLIVGSFLNVVVYRLPLMLERQWREQCAELAAGTTAAPAPSERFDLLAPRSACPQCKAPIKALHNIPVISYIALGGRCGACGAPIGIRYPLIEVLTGVISGAVALRFGFGWTTPVALIFSWFLIALTFIDLDHQLLPDSLTMPLIWLGVILSVWGPQSPLAPVPVAMRSSIIGAAAGYLSLWCVYHLFRLVTGKEGMGYGDFKLFAAIGAWLGWQLLLPTILVAAASGAVIGILALAARGKARGTAIPFGPFLAGAAWLMLMYGRELVSRYLGLFALSP